jgi:hypothetical protein
MSGLVFGTWLIAAVLAITTADSQNGQNHPVHARDFDLSTRPIGISGVFLCSSVFNAARQSSALDLQSGYLCCPNATSIGYEQSQARYYEG